MKKIGRYQITRELGRGAMGVVYHAIDPTIGRAVAIKTLRLREVDDGEQRLRLRERLFREARSAGALSHPGIVTIYDMDEVDGLAYIAMEFVDGETLEDILARPEPLKRDRVLEILQQAAAALDYAHRKGIIHRDIKPANVMIDTTGAVKITDFGIAKITQLEGQTITGVLVGTPNYMSPEQVQGHEIDGRSDQFSLGVIAYEMLSGERPFYGEQISTVVYKIVADQPVPIHNINKTLGEPVDKVLRRGLAKKPEKRFASCTAFITGLTGALENLKSWRVLPRRARVNVPAAVTDELTRTFRPVRKLRADDAPTVAEGKPSKERKVAGEKKKSSWLAPFFGAFLFLLAILALVAWQTGLLDLNSFRHEEAAVIAPPKAASPAEKTSTPPDTPTAPASDAESSPDRPSPMPAQTAASPEAQSKSEPSVSSPASFQALQVMSDPAEAMASLDGQSESTCQTPCKLRARSGVHSLTVSKDGYQTERREIRVEHQDVDVPLFSLRAANGILLLTSDPSSARVSLDGRSTEYLTPVRISLPAGNHTISIERDGMQATDHVEIRNGALSTLRLSVKRE